MLDQLPQYKRLQDGFFQRCVKKCGMHYIHIHINPYFMGELKGNQSMMHSHQVQAKHDFFIIMRNIFLISSFIFSSAEHDDINLPKTVYVQRVNGNFVHTHTPVKYPNLLGACHSYPSSRFCVCFFQTITFITSKQAAAAVAVAMPHVNERPHAASPAAGRGFGALLTLSATRQGAPERSCFSTISDMILTGKLE